MSRGSSQQGCGSCGVRVPTPSITVSDGQAYSVHAEVTNTMKPLRLMSVASLSVFCLLALQLQLKAQELQIHSVASLINDRDEIVGYSETSTPNPLVATTVRLSPTHLSFGSITIYSHSSPRTVTLTNVGTSSLTIYGISIIGTDPRDFAQTHTCGTKLTKGASCSFKVTFYPSAPGTRTAALSIRDNGGGSPQRVPLSGTGVTGRCLSRYSQCRPYDVCCPGLGCYAEGNRTFCVPK